MFLITKLFLVTIFSIIICFVVGAKTINYLRINKNESFFSLFLSLVTGVSIIVSIYAIVCTQGSTVQLPILLLIVAMLLLLRYRTNTISRNTINHATISRTGLEKLPLLLIIIIVVFSVQYLLLYDPASEYLQTPFQDYVYYSRLTLPLNHRGIETNSLEAVFPQFLTEQPYHYSEVWLNALLTRITGMPSVWIYFVTSTSVLISIICAGFMAVFAHFNIRNSWIPVLALLFLFLTGLRWTFLQHNLFIFNGALLSSLMLCLNPKFAPIYLYLLLGALLLLKRQYNAAGAALAILPLTFISTTPIIGVGMVVLTFYLVSTKKITLSGAIFMLLPVVVAAVCIVLFYILQPEPYQFPSTGRAFALRSIIPSAGEIKTLVNIAMGVIVNYAIYFFVYAALVLLIIVLRRQTKLLLTIPGEILIWFGASLVMAATMRAFGTHFLDSFQFFSNTMVPLTPIVLAVVLAAVLQGATKQIYALTVIVLTLLAVINFSAVGAGNTRYSPSFIKQVSQIAPQLGARGSFILADEDYENAYMLSPDSYTTGNYISNFKNDYAFISLSELDPDSLTTDSRFRRDSAQAEQIVRKSTFYRFAKFQALQKRKISLDSAKYEFVTRHNIGFICLSKRAKLPATLAPLVSATYTDSLSGERLCVLRPQKAGVALSAYDDLE